MATVTDSGGTSAPKALFRSLKGAPASVLCVLGFTRRPMTNQELQEWTGYGHDKVTEAIRLLLELGRVAAPGQRGPWSLTQRAEQDLVGSPSPECDSVALAARTSAGKSQSLPVPACSEIRAPGQVAMAVDDRPEVSPEAVMMLIQSLKGAPASVLLALAATRRPMSQQELQLWTRCGHNQVTLGVRSLVRIGWACGRTSRGPWTLTERSDVPALECLKVAIASKGLNDDDESLVIQTEGPSTTSASRRQLLEAMRDSGIEEPTASELAALPHVTVEYVRAHVAGARLRGLGVGAAIARMRLAAPVPAPMPRAQSRSEEIAEKIRRFMEAG